MESRITTILLFADDQTEAESEQASEEDEGLISDEDDTAELLTRTRRDLGPVITNSTTTRQQSGKESTAIRNLN